jgi:hypothetical protein
MWCRLVARKRTITIVAIGSIWDGHLGKWINDRRYRLHIQS